MIHCINIEFNFEEKNRSKNCYNLMKMQYIQFM